MVYVFEGTVKPVLLLSSLVINMHPILILGGKNVRKSKIRLV
jgi:hypothetical protein